MNEGLHKGDDSLICPKCFRKNKLFASDNSLYLRISRLRNLSTSCVVIVFVVQPSLIDKISSIFIPIYLTIIHETIFSHVFLQLNIIYYILIVIILETLIFVLIYKILFMPSIYEQCELQFDIGCRLRSKPVLSEKLIS